MVAKGGAVHVDGLRELRRFLKQLPGDVEKDGLKKIHDKVAEPVEAMAKQIAPRQSGYLAASIRRAKGSATRAVVRAGNSSVPYAGVQEWGWPNRRVVFGKTTSAPAPIAEHAYLRRALEARREKVLNIYTDELDRFIGYLMAKYNLH